MLFSKTPLLKPTTEANKSGLESWLLVRVSFTWKMGWSWGLVIGQGFIYMGKWNGLEGWLSVKVSFTLKNGMVLRAGYWSGFHFHWKMGWSWGLVISQGFIYMEKWDGLEGWLSVGVSFIWKNGMGFGRKQLYTGWCFLDLFTKLYNCINKDFFHFFFFFCDYCRGPAQNNGTITCKYCVV